MSDTPETNVADAYDTMEALLCEMQGLRDELVETRKELEEAQKIIAAALSILPCGHIPSHTPESIPDRIRELVESWVTAESERDEAREALVDWENAAKHVETDHPDEVHCGCVPVLRKLMSDSLRERDEGRKGELVAIADRERWRMRFEEKWAMRREIEEILGVASGEACDEQFAKGISALRQLKLERDEAMESSNERGVVVSQVSGALVDAGMAVGPASGFGALVGQLAKERNEALLQLGAIQSAKTEEV